MDWEALAGAAGAVRALLRRVSRTPATTAEPPAAEPLALETGDLPSLDQGTSVVLMAVDPYHVHAYWTVAASRIEAARTLLADDAAEPQAVLRFHDLTGPGFDGVNAHSSFDVDVYIPSKNWYVHLWSPEKRYCVDLGLRGKDGRFVALARSNVVDTPPVWPRAAVEEAALRVESLTPPAEAPLPVEAFAPPTPPDSAEVLKRKLAGIAAVAEQPLREPRPPEPAERQPLPVERPPEPSGVPAGSGQEPYADLTEMSEKKFSAGISSGEFGAPRSRQ